jgi:hypothetical protein
VQFPSSGDRFLQQSSLLPGDACEHRADLKNIITITDIYVKAIE